ncbi:MAG: DNA-directed RNA polymerase subunit omega [Blastocatellia bacterium]|nr:DNA-directed RNA polymerase subunit omega [Blastocatellia bacterium]
MKINDSNKSNKYRKVKMLIQRAKQLQNGARPRVLMPGIRSTRVAQEEFDQGLLEYQLIPLPKDNR